MPDTVLSPLYTDSFRYFKVLKAYMCIMHCFVKIGYKLSYYFPNILKGQIAVPKAV